MDQENGGLGGSSFSLILGGGSPSAGLSELSANSSRNSGACSFSEFILLGLVYSCPAVLLLWYLCWSQSLPPSANPIFRLLPPTPGDTESSCVKFLRDRGALKSCTPFPRIRGS